MGYSNSTVCTQPGLKMGWFKVQIHIILFIQAALDAFSGIEIIHGHEYTIVGYTMQQAHAQYGEWMHIMDYFVGAVLLCMAVFAIVTRFRLAGFHKDGIECLHILHYIDLGASMVYHLVLSFVLHGFCISPFVACEQIATLVMIIVNRPYFERREHLFKPAKE